MSRKLKLAAIALAGLLVVAGPVDGAVAKKKHHKKHKKHKVAPPQPGPVLTDRQTITLANSGDQGGATAVCPAGTVVVGGGASGSHTESPPTAALLIESRAVGSTGWEAKAVSLGAGTTLTVEAYCRANVAPLTEASQSTTVPAAVAPSLGSGTATATCPAGLKAVAGGFASPFTSGILEGTIANDSRRAPGESGWRVNGFTISTSPQQLTSFAYCSATGRIEVPGPVAAIGTVPAAAGSSDAAPCPTTPVTTTRTRIVKKHGKKRKKKIKTTVQQPTQPLSGGYELSDPDANPGSLHLAFPVESLRTPTGWRASGAELVPTSVTDTVTSFAYCGV